MVVIVEQLVARETEALGGNLPIVALSTPVQHKLEPLLLY
jgi:hypothetical protein